MENLGVYLLRTAEVRTSLPPGTGVLITLNCVDHFNRSARQKVEKGPWATQVFWVK